MFGRIRAIIKGSKSKKISPTITQPRQLKKTMEKMRSEFKQFAGKKSKTAKDRANVVRIKKSIERMKKLDKLQEKRKEGIKASKGVKDMIGRGEATKVGKSVFHKFVREKKAEGGMMDRLPREPAPKKDGLKKPTPDQKGLKKLPEKVRNKMGYMKKGGRVKKFPDLSGDGKVTKKDILMGRGVIKKKKFGGGKK